MDVRLAQLLGSLIGTGSDYTLARLEYAMRHPHQEAPPVIDRLPDASEQSLQAHWPRLETQLQRARQFTKHLDLDAGTDSEAALASAGWLRRTVRELDQYARAISWVITVMER